MLLSSPFRIGQRMLAGGKAKAGKKGPAVKQAPTKNILMKRKKEAALKQQRVASGAPKTNRIDPLTSALFSVDPLNVERHKESINDEEELTRRKIITEAWNKRCANQ